MYLATPDEYRAHIDDPSRGGPETYFLDSVALGTADPDENGSFEFSFRLEAQYTAGDGDRLGVAAGMQLLVVGKQQTEDGWHWSATSVAVS